MIFVDKTAPIGIFDSGVGGLTVLGRVRRLLPGENFIYYADEKNFPYGDKTEEEVRAAVFAAAEEMASKGIKMLVVACNTATAAAIEELRAAFAFPVLGIEPAIKPATERADSGRIAVIATRLTLKEEKFRRLFDDYSDVGEIIPLPAAGLADLVEKGHYNDDVGRSFLRMLFKDVAADTVVLGCTHYLFTLPLIREMFPDAVIIDGGEGLARNVVRTLDRLDLRSAAGEGTVTVLSSDDAFLGKFDGFFRDVNSILDGIAHKME